MGKGQKERALAAATASAGHAAGAGVPKAPTLADFLDFPALGATASAPKQPLQPEISEQAPIQERKGVDVLQQQPAALSQAAGAPVRDCSVATARPAGSPASIGQERKPSAAAVQQPAASSESPQPYVVLGSKKGGFPVTTESRAKGKKVTVIHNVTGDVGLLLSDLKAAVGAGGLVRDGDVEVQGEHMSRVEAFLTKKGCVKGVSRANQAAAAPKPKPQKPAEKSIAKLDEKASLLKQRS